MGVSFNWDANMPLLGREYMMNVKKMAERSAYATIASLAKMALTGSADPVSITATAILGIAAVILAVIDRKGGEND